MRVNNTNPAAAVLRAGGKLSGAWLLTASPIVAEIVAEGGFDIGVVDMEHGLSDILTLAQQIQAMKNTPMVPFVRPPWNDFVIIKRILDAGAMGLIVPYINNRGEAERAVRAIRYPGQGIRGLAGSTRAAHYGNNSIEYLSRANGEIFLFLQIETVPGVENIDEILAVEGVDGIFIGPMDLSTNMGHFANPAAAEVKDAIAALEKKVLAAGKALATIGNDWEDANAKYERGNNLVIYMSDATTLSAAARQRSEPFKKRYGGLE